MNIFENTNIELFRDKITDGLKNNITDYHCSTIANMLAIDYKTRLNSKLEIVSYIDKCVSKLRNFLGKKIITNDDFSTTLELFAVAIRNEKPSTEDNSGITKEQSEDILSQMIIDIYFKDFTENQKDSVKEILRSLEITPELIKYMESNTDLFRNIVKQAIVTKNNKHGLDHNLNIILKITETQKQLNQENVRRGQFFSKVITAISALVVGATGVLTAGVALPAMLLVPTSIVTIKYAPKIGEKIAGLIGNIKNIVRKKTLTDLSNELKNNIGGVVIRALPEEKPNIELLLDGSIDGLLKKYLQNVSDERSPTYIKTIAKSPPIKSISDKSNEEKQEKYSLNKF